ncbi:MAG: hypothetical protein ACPGUV_10270 [Polyangiales bacterium]
MIEVQLPEAQPGAMQLLRRSLAKDKLAQCYLFAGPPGVGKLQAAHWLAAEAMRLGPEALSHAADFRLLRPAEGKRHLAVDSLRQDLLPFVRHAPWHAPCAFVVIPDADEALPSHQPASANLLLKSLEEPRRGVHFILVSAAPLRLLATLRSRAVTVRFQRLPAPQLQALLRARGVSAATVDICVALSDGSATRALALAESDAKTLTEVRAQLCALEAALSARDLSALLRLAASCSELETPGLWLDVLEAQLLGRARAACGGTGGALDRVDWTGANVSALAPLSVDVGHAIQALRARLAGPASAQLAWEAFFMQLYRLSACA